MVAPLSKLPALPIAVGVVAGILSWTAGLSWWVGITFVCVGLFLFYKKLHFTAFALYAAAAGWAVADFNEPQSPPDGIFDGKEREFSAVVTKISTNNTGQSTVLRVDSIKVGNDRLPCESFKIRAYSLPDWSVFVGERIRFASILEPLDSYTDFPHDRDTRLFDLRQGAVAQTYLGDYDISRTGVEKSAAWWFGRQREHVLHLLAHSGLSDQAYGLIAAITVGYGDDLDGTLRENFRAAGIAHSLALSGFHVGIIVMLVTVALFPMRAVYRLRRVRLIVALALIWFYAAMVGMPESVVRAVGMLSVILVSNIFGSEANALNSLCAAVVIILAVSPFSLFSAGFQLSVAAVLGIVLLADHLNPFDSSRHFLHRVGILVAVPFAAIAGTMVVTAATFHRLPLLFAASNLIISLLLPLLMSGGIALIILTGMGFRAEWLCRAIDGLTSLTDLTVDSIANLSFAELSGIYLSTWQIAALALAVIAIIAMVNFRKKRVFAASAALFVCSVATVALCREEIPEREAFVVGQSGNTAIVVRNGSNLHAVFTCHPRRLESAGARFERRMKNYMESRGVETVEILTGDFQKDGFSRKGNILMIGDRHIALAVEPGHLDSISGHIDYALVSSRFRGSISEVERMFHPDTIVLARDLPLARAAGLQREASLPVISLR